MKPSRMFALVILATLAIVTAAGCGSDPEAVTAAAIESAAASNETSPQTAPDAPTVGWAQIRYATPVADDRLRLEYDGGPSPGVADNPCSADYAITVTEDAEAVVVSIAVLKTPELAAAQEQSGFKCPASQGVRSGEVTLQSPLGARAVIDGTTQVRVDPRR